MRIAVILALAGLSLSACQAMQGQTARANATQALQKTGITQQTNSNMATPQGAQAARAATTAGQTTPQP